VLRFYASALGPGGTSSAHHARRRGAAETGGGRRAGAGRRRYTLRIRPASTFHRRQISPLGLVPQRHAGHAQEVRLLLHAAGIGQHHARRLFERQHVQVSHRLDDPHRRLDLDVGAHEGGARARVHRQDHRLVQQRQRVDDVGEPRRVVGVGGACTVAST
jgi:hypothetical protein